MLYEKFKVKHEDLYGNIQMNKKGFSWVKTQLSMCLKGHTLFKKHLG